MRIIRDIQHCPSSARGAVIALGNFDGVHTGHQAIIRFARETADNIRTLSAVMTFEPHPREFFGRNTNRLRIYSLRQKLQLLKETGIDLLFLLRFNEKLASTPAHDFVEQILHGYLQAKHLVTGYNFAFGKERQGNVDMLTRYAQQAGFGYTACDPVLSQEGSPVSSSAIRAFLAAGEVKKAQALLGKPYHICGHVRAGDARGRTLGFPTANVSLHALFKPRLGVYTVRVRIDGEPHWYDAIANVGVKPTFSPTEPLLEVHIFNFDRTIYGKRIEVEFIAFLRPEAYFHTVDSLLEQINRDVLQAKHILQQRTVS